MCAAEKVKFGVAIPQVFPDGLMDMALVREGVQKAEALGYHSIWVQDGTVDDVPILDAVGLLCYVAALTTNVKLGTSVLVAPIRNPVQLAKILSSLDQMSNGRLIIGIGVGPRTGYYPAFGLEPKDRVPRFVEGLQVMKALWTDHSAHLEGQFWQLEGTAMEPKPLQRPHPPIWFGAENPAALKRAVQQGDGWMGAGISSPAQFEEQVAYLRRFLEEDGRDPSTFVISKRVYLAVDDDVRRAERRLTEWFARRYKDAKAYTSKLASEVCVWGSAAMCTEQLAEITKAGAQLLLLNPVFDLMEQMDRLGQDVMPHL